MITAWNGQKTVANGERRVSKIAGWEIVKIILAGKTEMRERSTKGMPRRVVLCFLLFNVFLVDLNRLIAVC